MDVVRERRGILGVHISEKIHSLEEKAVAKRLLFQIICFVHIEEIFRIQKLLSLEILGKPLVFVTENRDLQRRSDNVW